MEVILPYFSGHMNCGEIPIDSIFHCLCGFSNYNPSTCPACPSWLRAVSRLKRVPQHSFCSVSREMLDVEADAVPGFSKASSNWGSKLSGTHQPIRNGNEYVLSRNQGLTIWANGHNSKLESHIILALLRG